VPIVRVTASLDTTLDAFDAAAQASYTAELATTAGVTPSDITLAITGGSITVTATIRTATEAAAQSASAAIADAIASTAQSNTFLGFTTTATPAAPDVSLLTLAAPPPTPPPVDDGDNLPGWAGALIGIISGFFLLSFVFIFMLIGRERNGKPIFSMAPTVTAVPSSSTSQGENKSSV